MGKITLSSEAMKYLIKTAGKFTKSMKYPCIRFSDSPYELFHKNGNVISTRKKWNYSIHQTQDLKEPVDFKGLDLVISLRISKNAADVEIGLNEKTGHLEFISKGGENRRLGFLRKKDASGKAGRGRAIPIRSFDDLIQLHKEEIAFHKKKGIDFDHTDISSLMFMAGRLGLTLKEGQKVVKLIKLKNGNSRWKYSGNP